MEKVALRLFASLNRSEETKIDRELGRKQQQQHRKQQLCQSSCQVPFYAKMMYIHTCFQSNLNTFIICMSILFPTLRW